MIALLEPPLSVTQVSAIEDCLSRVCRITGMGFATVGRMTTTHYVAQAVVDRPSFDVAPGDAFDVEQTICYEVRRTGRALFIDDVAGDPHWRTHPTPALYGFESYVSLPLVLDDGEFYGTLCALDREPRQIDNDDTIAALEGCAMRIAAILSTGSGAAH